MPKDVLMHAYVLEYENEEKMHVIRCWTHYEILEFIKNGKIILATWIF